MNIGKSLKLCFAGSNKTTKELAVLLDVTTQTISNYRTGRAIPPIQSVQKMAEFFGLLVSEFIALGEESCLIQ